MEIQLFLPPANKVCEGNVLTGVCMSTWGSRSQSKGSPSWGVSVWGVSVQGVSVQGGSLSRGHLCPGVTLSGGFCLRGCLCPEVYVQGGLCPGVGVYVQGVSVQRGLYPGVSVWGSLSRGSLSRLVSVQWGCLCPGLVSVQGGLCHRMHSCLIIVLL